MMTLRNKLVVLFLIFQLCAPLVFSLSAGYAARFLQSLTVESSDNDKVMKVVYGNPDYGYFEIEPQSVDHRNVKAEIVPPGYRLPVEIYLRKKNGAGEFYLERKPDANFKFPLTPSELSPMPEQPKNNLTRPFYMGIRGKIQVPSGGQAHVAYLVNRMGEVVWACSMGARDTSVEVARQVSTGRFALLGAGGLFEVTRFDGEVEKSLNVHKEGHGVVMHHDFLLEDTGLLAFIHRDMKFSGKPGSTIKPDDYQVGQLVRADLQTGAVKLLWDALDDEPGLFPERPGLDAEFDHVNSVNHVAGKGYLISLRNFSTIIFLDEAFQFLWSLGDTPGAIISTKGTNFQFHLQHHATFLENGHILLVDNGWERSRFLEISVDEKKLSAKLIQEFLPATPLFGERQGSVYRLENGNTVGFLRQFEKSPKGKIIVEFDPEGYQMSQLNLPVSPLGDGYRMVPVEAIGLEKYLGRLVPVSRARQNRTGKN